MLGKMRYALHLPLNGRIRVRIFDMRLWFYSEKQGYYEYCLCRIHLEFADFGRQGAFSKVGLKRFREKQ